MEKELIKSVWPEWEIESQLGRGAYGVVYKAVRRDNNVESYSAIKVISIPMDSSETESLRSEGATEEGTKTFFYGIVNDFVNEIQLMQTFKGIQNIVSVEDYKVIEKKDEIGWHILIRMELLTPFNTYIRDKKMTESEVIKLGKDICTALEICGKKNIIHRDIKPENIFINDFGDFKLGDFGIARKLENTTGGLSQKGTFLYVAPEVANSTTYDYRADIYSLGIVLYRMLNANRLPFLDSDTQVLNPNDRKNAIDRRLRGEELPAPCEASANMSNLILRACAFNKNQRFSSATEMKDALSQVENGTYQPVDLSQDATGLLDYSNGTSGGTEIINHAHPQNTINPNVINTFGDKPKKKKTPLIILVAVVLIALIGAGVILLPKLLNRNGEVASADSDSRRNDDDDHDDEGNSAGTDTDSDDDPDEEDIAADREAQEKIKSVIDEAERYADSEYYEDAIKLIMQGLDEYPDSQELNAKLSEYESLLSEQIMNNVLAEAEKKASDGDYASAMAIIQNAIDSYGENLDYKKAYDSYKQSYYAEVKENALADAEALFQDGDYVNAVHTLNTAIVEVGGDSDLSAKAEEYEQTYVYYVLEYVDELMSVRDYSSATGAINDALKDFPDNTDLSDKLADIESKKPVSLASLDALNHEKNNMTMLDWNTDAPVDPFGNDYSSSINYQIYKQTSYYNSYCWSEYRIYGDYKEISGKLSPYTSIGQNSTIYFQIFADDNLVYTSPIIDRKTDQFSFLVDISGAEYIKIQVCGGSNNDRGALIISDVLLWPNV